MDWILRGEVVMNNDFPSRETEEELRKEQLKSTVVILDKMTDKQAPEIGTAGELGHSVKCNNSCKLIGFV